MATGQVLVVVEHGVGRLRLNRPVRHNAVNEELLAELEHELADLARCELMAIVLSGEGRSFCAGGDITMSREILDCGEAGFARHDALLDALAQVISAIDTAPVLTITAMTGATVAVGIGMALATDLRVMGESARIIPGWARMAASPDGGASSLLAGFLGPRRMRAFVLRGEPTLAAVAYSCGIADEIGPDEEVVARTLRLAELAPPAGAAANVRLLAQEAVRNDLDTQVGLEAELLRRLRTSDQRRAALTGWRRR